MGAADARAGAALEEVGIIRAPHEATRVEVDGVVLLDGADVGKGEQRGDVCVVDEESISKAVHFECIHAAVLGMVEDGVLGERGVHLVGERGAGRSALFIPVHRTQYLGGLAKHVHREEVGWHEERIGGGVVGRPERARDQTARLRRPAVSAVRQRVGGVERATAEAIGRARAALALLLAHDGENAVERGEPALVEYRGVAASLPVAVREAQGVAERVELVLALMKLGLHVGFVGHPLAALAVAVEGVGVGVEADARELAQHNAAHEATQGLVVLHEAQVRPHLCRRVAQPHGVYVACVDERVVFAVGAARVVHRGVERVGEAVAEEPCELRVAEGALHLVDLRVHGRAAEQTLLGRRPLRFEIRRTRRESGSHHGHRHQMCFIHDAIIPYRGARDNRDFRDNRDVRLSQQRKLRWHWNCHWLSA